MMLEGPSAALKSREARVSWDNPEHGTDSLLISELASAVNLM